VVLRLRIGGVDPSGTADGRGVLLSGSRPDPPDFILGPADGRAGLRGSAERAKTTGYGPSDPQ